MKVILFNGPPSCGKDTAARHLYDNWFDLGISPDEVHFDRMSMPIKAAFAGMTNTELDEFGNNLTYEKTKDQSLLILQGKSYRQWQIDFSETLMKPCYGEDVFARLFQDRCAKDSRSGWCLVPDCGFQIEAQTLSRNLLHKVFLIRVHRDGCDFSNDSREYLDAHRIDGKLYGVFDVTNRSLPGYQSEIVSILRHIERHF